MDTIQTVVQNEIVQTTSAMLDELGRRFGATGVHLWEAWVRYTFGRALSLCLLGVVLCVFAILMYRKQADPDVNRDTVVNCWIGIVICTGLALVFFGVAIPSLISPEGAVLRSLFRPPVW